MNKLKSTEEFQEKVESILKELLNKNGIEIYGNLKIEVANMDTLALLKGNRIYINIQAKRYPKYILKYVIAHELAHLVVRRHTKKFWEIVRRIYPHYERAKNDLLKRTKK
ncbi:MAG: M48 family metallopeptidase [Candidatus Bathyarchaeia archaeon]